MITESLGTEVPRLHTFCGSCRHLDTVNDTGEKCDRCGHAEVMVLNHYQVADLRDAGMIIEETP